MSKAKGMIGWVHPSSALELGLELSPPLGFLSNYQVNLAQHSSHLLETPRGLLARGLILGFSIAKSENAALLENSPPRNQFRGGNIEVGWD
jgi:hypothetical protein